MFCAISITLCITHIINSSLISAFICSDNHLFCIHSLSFELIILTVVLCEGWLSCLRVLHMVYGTKKVIRPAFPFSTASRITPTSTGHTPHRKPICCVSIAALVDDARCNNCSRCASTKHAASQPTKVRQLPSSKHVARAPIASSATSSINVEHNAAWCPHGKERLFCYRWRGWEAKLATMCSEIWDTVGLSGREEENKTLQAPSFELLLLQESWAC